MRKTVGLVVLFLLIGMLGLGCAPPAPSAPADTDTETAEPDKEAATPEPVVLKAVSSLARDNIINESLWEFEKNLADLTGGLVTIDFVGGPEAIPQLDQPEAVQQGIVDLSVISSSDYVTMYPLGHAMQLSPYSPSQERDKGVYGILDTTHQKIGIKYLMRVDWQLETLIWSSVRFDSPRDMAGQTFRSLPMYDEAFSRLDVNRVPINMEEMFTAMERKMIVGFPVPSPAVIPTGLYETVDYVYSPPMWCSAMSLIMNLEKWNKLPAELQNLVEEAAALTEKTWVETGQQVEWEKLMQVFYDAGGEQITWTGEDAAWFIETVHSAKWDEIMGLDPEDGQKLQDLYSEGR